MSAMLLLLWLFFIVNTIVTWVFVTNAGCKTSAKFGYDCSTVETEEDTSPAPAPAPGPSPSTTSGYAREYYRSM